MKKIFAVAVLAVFCATPFQAAGAATPPVNVPVAPVITISNLTGTIKVTAADGTVATYKPGDSVPAIQPGSSVNVVSGAANFTMNGSTVKADTGDSFVFTNNTDRGSQITVNAGSVQVVVGNTTATVDKGNAVAVSPSETNPHATISNVISVISGIVSFNSAGVPSTVAAGDVFYVLTAKQNGTTAAVQFVESIREMGLHVGEWDNSKVVGNSPSQEISPSSP